MKLLLVLAFANILCGQVTPVPPAALPSNWVGAGGGYNPSGSPKGTAWASFATLVAPSAGLYSYTTYDVVPNRDSVPTSSTRTGLAMVIHQYGKNLFLVGFVNGGMSQTATATLGSVSGGGLLLYKFKNNMTFEAGYRGVSNSTTARVFEFGLGGAW